MRLSKSLSILLLLIGSITFAESYTYHWSSTHDRTWTGSNFWANRLQDWEVNNGRLECKADQSRLSVRTLHALTHGLNAPSGRFQMRIGKTSSVSRVSFLNCSLSVVS